MGLLQRLLKQAEEGGRLGTAIEILVLEALGHEVQGEINQALSPLEKALALAGPEGHARIFLDEGRPMARLLDEALSRGLAVDEVRRLLAAFSERAAAPAPSIPPAPDVEPLSEREREVLQLLAGGLTNQEIADRLVLSLYTVKAHARSIYAKLGVRNRTQAAARGKALGILPPA